MAAGFLQTSRSVRKKASNIYSREDQTSDGVARESAGLRVRISPLLFGDLVTVEFAH